PVLKTGDGKPFESSNLSSSAIKFNGSAIAGPFCFLLPEPVLPDNYQTYEKHPVSFQSPDAP
ncbi:hypothetical protein, partial [Erwinia sp. 198]|uniref:hypothetical protein n=1 Tax=Erwinia sp. 198 TaxID=2022746 RepID=UPI001F27B43F